MSDNLSYGQIFPEEIWGSTFHEIAGVSDSGNIFICYGKISDLDKMALELTSSVNNYSWVIDLDHRARRAYQTTAQKTAEALVKIFKDIYSPDNKITSEFGELMVSMGSSKALEIVFGHRALPIAELWKPKLSQNEGFDFHTVCSKDIINFGEAKFSSNSSPYSGASGQSSGAGGQADGFIAAEKHLMDGPHLGPIAGDIPAANLDSDIFGIVLAFSINAVNPLTILNNALMQSKTYENLKKAKNIYIVGISHEY